MSRIKKTRIWLSCFLLLWSGMASAEEQWKANIREFCEQRWEEKSDSKEQCIDEQMQIAGAFAYLYQENEDFNYRVMGPRKKEVYRACWEEFTEDGLTDWYKVQDCIEYAERMR